MLIGLQDTSLFVELRVGIFICAVYKISVSSFGIIFPLAELNCVLL